MHYVVLYPQHGDRIVTTDSVTSLHAMYCSIKVMMFTCFKCIVKTQNALHLSYTTELQSWLKVYI